MFDKLKLKIKSKNIKSILIFLILLYYLLDKLYIIRKIINKQNNLTIFTILKSPHIYKIAQQHFGFKFFNKIIYIKLINFYSFVLCLKLFKKELFQDIYLILSYIIIKKTDKVMTNIYFSLLKICLNFYRSEISVIMFKQMIIQFLNILNFTGIKILFFS